MCPGSLESFHISQLSIKIEYFGKVGYVGMGMWRGRKWRTGCQSVGGWRLRGAGVGAGLRRRGSRV